MEEELDEIAAGDRAWVPTLHEFYGPFVETLARPSRRWSEFGSKMNRPGKTASSAAARWSSSWEVREVPGVQRFSRLP